VRDYLSGLAPRERARVTTGIDLLETFGLALGMPHVRSVGDKLRVLRVRGQMQHRVLYAATTGRRLAADPNGGAENSEAAHGRLS